MQGNLLSFKMIIHFSSFSSFRYISNLPCHFNWQSHRRRCIVTHDVCLCVVSLIRENECWDCKFFRLLQYHYIIWLAFEGVMLLISQYWQIKKLENIREDWLTNKLGLTQKNYSNIIHSFQRISLKMGVEVALKSF